MSNSWPYFRGSRRETDNLAPLDNQLKAGVPNSEKEPKMKFELVEVLRAQTLNCSKVIALSWSTAAQSTSGRAARGWRRLWPATIHVHQLKLSINFARRRLLFWSSFILIDCYLHPDCCLTRALLNCDSKGLLAWPLARWGWPRLGRSFLFQLPIR